MMLWDRCELWTYRVSYDSPRTLVLADIPCQVSSIDTLRNAADDAVLAIKTTVRAILPAGLPVVIIPSGTEGTDEDGYPVVGGHELDWRGESWQIVGVPLWRRKRGRDHHQTIELLGQGF